MATSHDRLLTPRQVAEIWFRTPRPSAEQVRKVYDRMESGALPVVDPQAPRARWKTSEPTLARFLARRATARPRSETGDTAAPPPPGLARDAELRRTYRHLWQDYFLAVMLRRRVPDASRRFRRAVIAGQVLILATIAAGVSAAVVGAGQGRPTSEQRAVAAWIATSHGWHQIDRWHAAAKDPQGRRLLRVEYRYRDGDSHRVVRSDRTFVVTADRAEEYLPAGGE